MAGNYPDVSSWRMALDVDGTQVVRWVDSGIPNTQDPARVTASNDERTTMNDGIDISESSSQNWYAWIFPELRDVDGYMVSGASSGNPNDQAWQASPDTTNGVDGTWVNIAPSDWPTNATLVRGGPRGRTGMTWNTVLGVKALRFMISTTNGYGNRNSVGLHVYGEPAPGENLQRLEIWHPTLDQRLGPADLDWGDVPRNSTEIREFRVKNMHPTLTANSVRAAVSILTDTSPSVVGQQAISKDDGATWGARQTLTSPLGPEAISPVLQLRRQTPANATLSLWWYRVFADCSSWT